MAPTGPTLWGFDAHLDESVSTCDSSKGGRTLKGRSIKNIAAVVANNQEDPQTIVRGQVTQLGNIKVL